MRLLVIIAMLASSVAQADRRGEVSNGHYHIRGAKPSNCPASSSCTWTDTSGVLQEQALGKAPTRTAVANTDYTVTTGDYFIAYTSIAASRTVTLPLASSGRHILIGDESGSASGSVKIKVIRSGSDTVNGSTSAVDLVVTAYGGGLCTSNGATKWRCQ